MHAFVHVHSHIPRSIRASVLCACASTTWWHLNQLFAGSKPSRTLLCLVSVSFGFKGDTTGTVPHPCSTGRAFICQICPLWASPLSPPALSTGTPFNRALPLSTQTFKTHRAGFTQNELRPLIACCLRCFSTERCKQGQKILHWAQFVLGVDRLSAWPIIGADIKLFTDYRYRPISKHICRYFFFLYIYIYIYIFL